MKATWEKLESNWYQFTVEVPAEQFSEAVNRAYRKLVKKARIPGFRPGKAPRFVFERYYGKETLLDEAVEEVVPRAYTEALRHLEAEPIDRPDITLETVEEGKPLVFKGKVQVKPDVKLGPLSGFDLPAPEPRVTEEQVNEQLRILQERAAQLVPDETGEVRQGSFAIIDFEGFVDGKPLEGGKAEDYTLEIGSGRLVPGFEEQLVGAKVGETREIKITFPADFHIEHLRGQDASFKVTVKDVKKKELPALDDAFAQSVSRFQSLQELRDDISNRLLEAARHAAEREFQNALLDKVAEAAEVDVPEIMVHRRIHVLIDELAHSLSRQGLTLEQYMQMTGKDSEALHKEFEEPARKQVKVELVLEAVAKQAGLTVGDDEIDAEIEASGRGLPASQLAELRRDAEYRRWVRESLLKRKAVAHLLALNRPAEAAAAATETAAAGEAGKPAEAPAGGQKGSDRKSGGEQPAGAESEPQPE